MRTDLSICAVITARNEYQYLRYLLPLLADQDIDVAIIDNESTDSSHELYAAYTPSPVISVESLPYHGFASLTDRMASKRALYQKLHHSWLVHHDVDEILEHVCPGRNLRDAIKEADAAGYTAINFDEFVFLPEPDKDYFNKNYYTGLLRYYFFEPHGNRLNRAWKNETGATNHDSGGHSLSGENLIFYPVNHILRHYIVLSAEHAIMGIDTYRPVDFGAIMASKGCPYNCTFCGVFNIWSKKVRLRSPVNVVSEIKWLYDTYGTRYFSFRDASFTLDRARVIELCNEILSQVLKIQWECTTRLDLLDDQIILLMKRAGCMSIRLGIESGSIELLSYMKKHADLEKVRIAAALLNRHNFYWSAYFLFGTPRETKETIRQTLDFIKEVNPPFVTISRFVPIPGTEMYDELVLAGLINPGIDWGEEGNQQRHTNYTLNIPGDEFDEVMDEVVSFIEAHNRGKSAVMQMQDGRMK